MIFNQAYPSICVYAGSADGLAAEYIDQAYLLGKRLAEEGVRLVYGAGKTGLMGAVADGTLQNGGKVTGIIPESLNQPQLLHNGLTELEVVPTIHQRKARMSELASAFIALPGGFGTFEELFETLAWAQIGLHHKPIGLLNTNGYYDPLLGLIEHTQKAGFIYPEHCQLLVQAAQPDALFEKLAQYTGPVGLDRWVTRPETNNPTPSIL